MRGRFITLEGCEGVGKTTNVELVSSLARAAGHSVVVTREPGGTPLGEELRRVLLEVREDGMSAMAELLLIFAARAEHISRVIEPALAAGRWVVCDRFTDATYAYQGGGRGMGSTVVQALENLVQRGLRPDLTIYLDLPFAVARERMADRDLDRFEREQEAFFQRVRDAYLERARSCPQIQIVDASCSLGEVQSDIDRVMRRFLTDASA